MGHPFVRSHPNIIRLEGVCWDIAFDKEEVWLVLVFEKARHGHLRKFVSTNAGGPIKWDDRVKLCADIATAIMLMHSSSKQTMPLIAKYLITELTIPVNRTRRYQTGEHPSIRRRKWPVCRKNN